MKHKILLTSLLGLTIVCPSFAAVDISKNANNPGCTNSVLHTYSGPTDLEADYTANTININFYSDENTVYSTGTCTYDGSIELPEEDPTRTGYTFDGWQVRRASVHAQQCDLSGLSDTTTGAFAYAYINFDGTESTANSDGIKKTPDTYNITNNGEWAAEFYYGIVKGISRCSTVGGGYTEGQTGNPTDDLNVEGAQYCWCQMTGYTPKPWVYDTGDSSSSPIYLTGYTNQSTCKTAIRAITRLSSSKANTLLNNASSANPQLITNATGANLAYLTDSGCTTSGGASGHFGENGNECPVASLWVFNYDHGSAASCASLCTNFCGIRARFNGALRVGLFGSVASN